MRRALPPSAGSIPPTPPRHTSWGLGKVSPSFSAPPLPHTLTKGTLKSADRVGRGHLSTRQAGYFHLMGLLPALATAVCPAFPSSRSILINLSHLTSQTHPLHPRLLSAPPPPVPIGEAPPSQHLRADRYWGLSVTTGAMEENAPTVPGSSHSSGLTAGVRAFPHYSHKDTSYQPNLKPCSGTHIAQYFTAIHIPTP